MQSKDWSQETMSETTRIFLINNLNQSLFYAIVRGGANVPSRFTTFHGKTLIEQNEIKDTTSNTQTRRLNNPTVECSNE